MIVTLFGGHIARSLSHNCSVNVKVEFKRDCGVLEEMDFFLPW